MRKFRVTVASLAVLLCGYTFADAWDVVPGWITLQPTEDRAQPYPKLEVSDVASITAPETPDANAAQADAAKVNAALKQLRLAFPEQARVGALVVDAQTGDVVGQLNANQAITPASTMKVGTALALLSSYGPDARLTTAVKADGAKLYLVGGGDILLGADVGEADATIGHAGLADLAKSTAAKLREQGTAKVTLALDTSLFSGPSYEPSWEDWASQWVIESTPISIDRSQWDGTGNPALSTPGSKGRALQRFAQLLRAEKIAVTLAPSVKAPASATELAKVESAPIREFVDQMLLVSDNSLAETAAHLVAAKLGKAADFAGGAQAVREQLTSLGLDLTGVTLIDGSGLSENNRLTAKFLVSELQLVWRCAADSGVPGCAMESVGASLPVAGWDGTLHDRFANLAVRGNLRAKTGSLPGVVSMAGYMTTNSGRPLIFAVLVDGADEAKTLDNRRAVDVALNAIAAAGAASGS